MRVPIQPSTAKDTIITRANAIQSRFMFFLDDYFLYFLFSIPQAVQEWAVNAVRTVSPAIKKPRLRSMQ
jgi:hypothetical protein